MWQIQLSSSLRFHFERNDTECPTYVSEKNTRVGCIQPYNTRNNRFKSFYTNLQHGSINVLMEHKLKNKGSFILTAIFRKVAVPGENIISFSTVKLKPPSNLTVKVGSDSNLWYYWNQSDPSCEENEVRYRINNREWDVSQTRDTLQTISTSFASLCHHLYISPAEFLRQLQKLLHQPPLWQLTVWATGARQTGQQMWRVHILERMEQAGAVGVQQQHR